MGWITYKGRRFYKDDSTGKLKKDAFGNPHNSKYDIVRFYRDDNKRPRIISRNVDGSIAHAHVNNPKTRKEGVYFDGFRKAE